MLNNPAQPRVELIRKVEKVAKELSILPWASEFSADMGSEIFDKKLRMAFLAGLGTDLRYVLATCSKK
jgi:hypothetical protein